MTYFTIKIRTWRQTNIITDDLKRIKKNDGGGGEKKKEQKKTTVQVKSLIYFLIVFN